MVYPERDHSVHNIDVMNWDDLSPTWLNGGEEGEQGEEKEGEEEDEETPLMESSHKEQEEEGGEESPCDPPVPRVPGYVKSWAHIKLPPSSKGIFKDQLVRQTGTMYGMVLESVQHYVTHLHGNDVWTRIVMEAGVANTVFTTHGRYSDAIILRLASACSDVSKDRTREEYMCFFGQCFVEYCSHYGYDRIMRVSGRHYRDFLRGIDNLHETMRFSYPKMVNPSFYVDQEDARGCVLHYRSKRIGFTHYVIGQLTQFATKYYSVRVDIDVLQEQVHDKGCHVMFRLNFDNHVYCQRRPSHVASCLNPFPPIEQSTFFKVFPFALVFDKSLKISHMGPSLKLLFKRPLVGLQVQNHFLLRRPLMDFTYENVLCHQSVMFELETRGSLAPVAPRYSVSGEKVYRDDPASMSRVYDDDNNVVLLKGQMRLIPDLRGIAFLCTPLLGNIDDLETLRLKLNDLSMYDSSRDMVLRGWQHASAIEYTLEQQVKKSKQIGENMAQQDAWKRRSEQLLYAMIPRSIAERLRNGEDPINTCQMFDSVTIIFSYLVGFTEVCAHLPALQCIELINGIFSMFDNVVDEFAIFKVETLGDAVYMAAGGVPDVTADHAVRVAGVALTLRSKIQEQALHPGSAESFNIRIGMHTGGVVAGVVGKRTPQYCLFGDTVNTASRMQTYSQPGAIHISEPCKQQIDGHGFITHLRGTMDIKGKGGMSTYWLIGREGDSQLPEMAPPCNEYTEYGQTGDLPIRQEPPRVIKGGFCIGTTSVECHSVQNNLQPEDSNLSDNSNDEAISYLSRPSPKICVEDFKSFLARKAPKPDKMGALTCPFSGVKIDPCCFFGERENSNASNSDDVSGKLPNEGDREKIESPSLKNGRERKDTEHSYLWGEMGEREGEETKSKKQEKEAKSKDTMAARILKSGSPNSFTFLDEVRVSIDGAANKLNESIRSYQEELRTESKLRRHVGLSLSQSVDCLSIGSEWAATTFPSSSSFSNNAKRPLHCSELYLNMSMRSKSFTDDLPQQSVFLPEPLPRSSLKSRKFSEPAFAFAASSPLSGLPEPDMENDSQSESNSPENTKCSSVTTANSRKERRPGTYSGPTEQQRKALQRQLNAEKRHTSTTEDLFHMEDLSQ